jgi:hypothetical protein
MIAVPRSECNAVPRFAFSHSSLSLDDFAHRLPRFAKLWNVAPIWHRFLRYSIPGDWTRYDRLAVVEELTLAKAAILALTQMPYQRSWADRLQSIQVKREVAGTSRIEGADFTDRELDAALRETPEQLETRSQKQAAAAVATYRWTAGLENDRPVDEALICDVHRRLVTT